MNLTRLLLLCLLLASRFAEADEEQPWLIWLDASKQALAAIDGYTAIFHKRELLDGKLLEFQPVELKFMKPFRVSVAWKNPGGGHGEAVYASGWNDNRLWVHPGGGWGPVAINLDPGSRWVMRYNRHRITEIGLEHLVDLLEANVRRAIAAGELTTIERGEERMFGRSAAALEAILPADKSRGYYCRRAVVHFDMESNLPINVTVYDWKNRQVERYGYEGLRTDVLMSAADFDPSIGTFP